MYVCRFCDKSVGPRVALLRHTVLRSVSEGLGKERGSILREVPICPMCYLRIRTGERPGSVERNGRPVPQPQENSILAQLLPPKRIKELSAPVVKVFETDAE